MYGVYVQCVCVWGGGGGDEENSIAYGNSTIAKTKRKVSYPLIEVT